jgi:hypothetical protein
MEATSSSRTANDTALELAPACPRCQRRMLLRAEYRDGRTPRVYFGCSYAACGATRRVTDPATVRPQAADASVQAVFEWHRAHEQQAERPDGLAGGLTGLRAAVGRYLTRAGTRADSALDEAAPAGLAAHLPPSRLANLVEHGFIVLDERGASFQRAWIDHLVIGPTGVFAVDNKPWAGQLAFAEGGLFIDGRQRTGATDGIVHAAEAIGDVLRHELKPVGVTVRPVLCFGRASPPWFKAEVDGVLVTNGRALIRALREQQPALGPETVVRLALAADRLLE